MHKIFKYLFLFQIISCLYFSQAFSADISSIKEIVAGSKKIEIELTKKTKIETIELSEKEFLLVVHNAKIDKNTKQKYLKKTIVNEVAYGQFKGNAIALIFNLKVKFKIVKSYWSNEKKFTIDIEPLEIVIVKGKTLLDEQRKLKKLKINKHKEYFKKFKKNYTGSIKDIIPLMLDNECFKTNETLKKIKSSLSQQNDFSLISIILKKYIDTISSYNKLNKCDEIIYYLYSYSLIAKSDLKKESILSLISMEDFFVNTLTLFPESKYKPFLYIFLAKIKLELSQDFEAAAYFKIVLNNYPAFIATPEVMHLFASLKLKNNQNQEVIKLLRELTQFYPNSISAKKSFFELGRALFREKIYESAILSLNKVVKIEPELSKDKNFLWVMGNSYYELKKYDKALPYFVQFCNFYPNDKKSPPSLKKIGDIYFNLGKKKESVNIYKLIIEKYPDTDSFIFASFKITELIDDYSEKEKILKNIADKNQNHKLIEEILIELAIVYEKEEKYDKAFSTCKKIISLHGNSKKQALELIFKIVKKHFELNQYEKSIALLDTLRLEKFQDKSEKLDKLILEIYTNYFRKLTNEGKFLEIISFVDQDREQIEQFNSSEIHFYTGNAYDHFQSYDKAYVMFQKAYDISIEEDDEDALFSDLLIKIANVALNLGRKNEALKFFLDGIELKNKKGESVDNQIYVKIAHIFLEKQEYDNALSYLNRAYLVANDINGKIDILHQQSEIYRNINEIDNFIITMESIIDLLLTQTPIDTGKIFNTYKNIGAICLINKDYKRALNYLDKATTSYLKDDFDIELNFMIGVTSQALHKYEEAKKIYNEILKHTDDIFWTNNIDAKIKEVDLKLKDENF